MTNFEALRLVITTGITLLFRKSVNDIYSRFFPIHREKIISALLYYFLKEVKTLDFVSFPWLKLDNSHKIFFVTGLGKILVAPWNFLFVKSHWSPNFFKNTFIIMHELLKCKFPCSTKNVFWMLNSNLDIAIFE